MKKTVLVLALLAVAKLTSAQNLVKDPNFVSSSFMANDAIKKSPLKSVWYPYLTSNEQALLSVEDTDKGKAASIKTLSKVSYAYSYIGQKIEEDNIQEGVYTVSFSAKATTDVPTYISLYLRIKTPPQQFLFFPLNNYNTEQMSTSSGALKQIKVTNEWKKYSVDFDLGKTINGVAAPAIAKQPIVVEKASGEDRKAFEIAFSGLSKNAGLLFTDVVFVKK